MHLDAARVRPFHQVLERVEGGRVIGVVGGRLERAQVVGIAAAAHLRDHRIRIGGDQVVEHLLDL